MSKSAIESLWQDLKTQRDELKLKIHLAAAEIEEEWQKIEDKKWPEIEHRLRELEEGTEEQIAEVGKALEIVGDEIKNAYSRIKSRLDD